MSQSNSRAIHSSRKRIAVFFGGRSPEHDVSIVTGLQILQALDRTLYDAFPVYITPDGVWLTGDVLRRRENYMLDKNNRAAAQEVTLDVTAGKTGRLLPKKKGLFGGGKMIEFDVALPSFHGLYGEDGNVQGLFEFAGVPYAGMRTLASSILMDKAATKKVLHALGIPVLPYTIIRRPDEGYIVPRAELEKVIGNMAFPLIVKPSHLGSSIGVAKVNSIDEIAPCLPAIFEFDDTAIVEPFVQNLVEYNVAVAKIGGRIVTSAIERPKAKDELLDFKAKYLSGGGAKGGSKAGTKVPGQSSQGMLSLTRELNPQLNPRMEEDLRLWAARMFDGLDGTGAARIDFICDSKAGRIWLNEVNPWPGSIGYFLWEAAPEPVLFADLLNHLVNEALEQRKARTLPKDPVPMDARLHKRPVH
jgi:D-alanine-D-alanine ligase